MVKKDQNRTYMEQESERVEAVLNLLRQQAPFSLKQEKFCNKACVERFLKSKGDNVKKAAKQLRACLSWRDSIAIDHLMADEFSSELAEGSAYVAGLDDESRPVMILRMKRDYQKFHSQKLFTRLLVFTLEVAIQTMPSDAEQFVLLIDASFYRSASAFTNMLVGTLKTIAEYYPGRLYRAFVIDPPSLFPYVWKGVRPFVELSPVTTVVSSLDFEDPLEFNHFSSCPQASSLRFDPSTARIGSCVSTRFSVTVSHQLNDTSSPKISPTVGPSPSLPGAAHISPLNGRSFSFASLVGRTPRGAIRAGQKGFFPSTPLPRKLDPVMGTHPRRALRPALLRYPALMFAKQCHVSGSEKPRDSFRPFLKFYRWAYDEMTYRSKMRPPLGGLISIVYPQLGQRNVSASQRF
ncbi:uncharacterized protein LOC127811305 [Diospyros lotus]|uniref:uncharacterized protein LOC127811305 n=1 Tax=Diospyros lotus TaxID=55363 RepID=UPI002259C6A0|nr:uncharacterized protein LOC127811305 [Diospyros lotus]